MTEAEGRKLFEKMGMPFPERTRGRPASSSIEDEMNKTERSYAAWLESRKLAGEIAWYGYACLTLRLAKRTHFRVDFAILNADGSIELVDVKGAKGNGYYARDDAKLKIKVAARMFPFRFKIAWRVGRNWQHEEMAK